MSPEAKTGFPGGLDPGALCETWGTPLYVYDARVMLEQLATFRAAFSKLPHRILYAAKALSTLEVLRLFRKEGTGLDAVSVEEIELGLRAGFRPADILFTPSFPSAGDLERAAGLGARINIDSLSTLDKFVGCHGSTTACCLRLKPWLRAGESAEAVERWREDSKFGIALDELDTACERARSKGLRIEGLHVHSSSVILDAGVFLETAGALFEAAGNIPELDYLDFGGGIKVPHRQEDPVIDLAGLARRLEPLYRNFSQGREKELELWFEPGRFLVSRAGILLARVTGLKENDGEVLAGVDTGFHHLLRPRLYGAWHEVTNLSNPGGEPAEYRIVGQLCEPDDLATARLIPEIREGDLLAFHNAGAYGASMASNYNSRLRPAELLLQEGEAKLIRRRETLEDLLHTQPGA